MADAYDSARNFFGNLPVVGPPLQGLFGDPAEEDLQREFAKAQQRAQDARRASAMMRPQSLENALAAFGPADMMLQQMYGPQFGMDFESLVRASHSPGLIPPPTPQQPQPIGPTAPMASAAFSPAARPRMGLSPAAPPGLVPDPFGGRNG